MPTTVTIMITDIVPPPLWGTVGVCRVLLTRGLSAVVASVVSAVVASVVATVVAVVAAVVVGLVV